MRFFKRNRRSKNDSPYTKDHFDLKYVHIAAHTYGLPIIKDWDGKTSLYVGKYCSIAEKVLILLGGNHRTDWVTTYPFSELSQQFPNYKSLTGHPSTKGDIVIGNDVWIGTAATILSGVTIGDGAVIGAMSVVSKNVPPYAIAVGNPAVVVKYRFDAAIIEELLDIKWWDWDEEKINSHHELIYQPDVEKFVNTFSLRK
jgi:acetyltransferase-like isoleucine patch superfamily enzyme